MTETKECGCQMKNESLQKLTRVANYLFLKMCEASGVGDIELEIYYRDGFYLADKLEKEVV